MKARVLWLLQAESASVGFSGVLGWAQLSSQVGCVRAGRVMRDK